MIIIQIKEQLIEDTPLRPNDRDHVLPFLEDGEEVLCDVKRGREEHALCLRLVRSKDSIKATSSYFVGVDWIKEGELAVQVIPKMNDEFEIDYVGMLNEALQEPENYEHLKDLVTIRFEKPSIWVNQQQDLLSIFLITEYLNILQRIVVKGLKKSYYEIEENIKNKVKGRILIGKNIHQNLTKGRITNNVCRYQVYDIDSPENRILKKALLFCTKQLEAYKHATATSTLEKKARIIIPYFASIGDEVPLKTIKTYKGNPIFKEYNQAISMAQLLLRRYSYNITNVGKQEIYTPPFWIDMSKLFELYVLHHLRQVFTPMEEILYHPRVHYQELDYLLKPSPCSVWPPFIIDAKYKPRYKGTGGISKEDAREVAGYARLSEIYKELKLDEDNAPPIKCLIIYPDQDMEERFTFTSTTEPAFEKVADYIRFYKQGIRLPEIESN